SYARQLVTLTYPHIGNTGCNDQDDESDGIKAAGLIMRDYPLLASSWRMQETLADFLKRQGTVAIADIDTRKLTRILREQGAQHGAIVCGPDATVEAALELANSFPGMVGLDLAREVSCSEPYSWEQGVWDLDSQQWG